MKGEELPAHGGIWIAELDVALATAQIIAQYAIICRVDLCNPSSISRRLSVRLLIALAFSDNRVKNRDLWDIA
jgi:hypothetical protein